MSCRIKDERDRIFFTCTCCLEEARLAEVMGKTLIASVTGNKSHTVLCE